MVHPRLQVDSMAKAKSKKIAGSSKRPALTTRNKPNKNTSSPFPTQSERRIYQYFQPIEAKTSQDTKKQTGYGTPKSPSESSTAAIKLRESAA